MFFFSFHEVREEKRGGSRALTTYCSKERRVMKLDSAASAALCTMNLALTVHRLLFIIFSFILTLCDSVLLSFFLDFVVVHLFTSIPLSRSKFQAEGVFFIFSSVRSLGQSVSESQRSTARRRLSCPDFRR